MKTTDYFFPEILKKKINKDICLNSRSERKNSEYAAASTLEPKFNNSYHLRLQNNIIMTINNENNGKIQKSLKSFKNIIKNMNSSSSIETPRQRIKYNSTYHQKKLNTTEELSPKLTNRPKFTNSQLNSLILSSKNNILLKGLNKENREKFTQISTFFKNISDVISEKLLNISYETQKEITEILSNLQGEFNSFINILLEEINKLKSESSKDVEINQLSLKISQLTKEIELLLKNSQSTQTLIKEDKESKEDAEIIREKYSKYYENSQKIIKSQEKKLEIILTKYNGFKNMKEGFQNQLQVIETIKKTILNMENEKNVLWKKINEMKETILMQNEEILTTKSENVINSNHIVKAISQMNTTSRKFNRNTTILAPEEKAYYSIDALNEVRQVVSAEFSKIIDFPNDSEENINFNEIELDKFQISKPTFFFCFNKIPTKISINPNSMDNLMLLVTMRGILDSKHNEYLLSDNYKTYTNFSNFVYSWLCNFYIDGDKRCVLQRSFQATHEVANGFIDHLLSFNKTWELFTFKEFLEEKASLDEIFFYLHCRFLLFNGPQLKRMRAGYDYIDYMNIESVIKVLDLVFKNFDQQTRNFIINKLKAKIKINGIIVLIDSAYALRIFLEYYKLERKVIYKLLYKNFLASSKKSHVLKDFFAFDNLINKMLPSCSDLEKIELYRFSYEISKGNIKPDVIFTAFSETGFLIKLIKSRFFCDFLYEEDYNFTINYINKNFKKMNDDITFIQHKLQNLGIEYFSEEFNKYQTIFIEKNFNFYIKNSFLGKNLFMIYTHFIEILLKIRNIQVFNNFNTAENEIFFLKNDFLAYDNLFVLIRTYMKMEKLKEFEINRSVKKIQSTIKRKINKWYTLLQHLIPGKAKSKLLT